MFIRPDRDTRRPVPVIPRPRDSHTSFSRAGTVRRNRASQGNRLKEKHGPGQGLAGLRESSLAADARGWPRIRGSGRTDLATAQEHPRTSAAKMSFPQPRRSSPPNPGAMVQAIGLTEKESIVARALFA